MGLMGTGDDSKDWKAVAVAFGTRVTQERKTAGMTKEALGQRSGLASRYLWRVEAGKQNIQIGNVAKIASGLGITVAELLTGVEQLVENPVPKPPVRPRGPAARQKD